MFGRSGKSKKILLSMAAVGVAASIAGLGTYATFTSTTSASQTLSSGTVKIALGAEGTADNRLTIGASGLVPGDSLQRRIVLSNTGSENLASLELVTTAPTSSLLDTDATNGLQMRVEKCTGGVGWTESATPYTYTCDDVTAGDKLGTRADVLARQAIIGTDAITGAGALSAAGSDDWVVTVDLPTTADNTFQGLTSTIDYTFTGTQRAGTSK